jgi:uncharacterized Zn-binding protein involved in type VI secretion
MPLSQNKALEFATRQASLGATAEATRTMADLSARGEALPKKKTHHKPSPDQIRGGADGAFRSIGEYEKDGDEGKLTAGLLGAAGNFLPSDISKMIPLAQFALDGSWTKFLSGDKKAIETALSALGKILPPELSKLLSKASPLLTKGLESLLGGKDLGDMFSLEGLMGLAGQLLPKEYGDALAVAQELYNKFPESMSDLAGSLDSLVGRFLPPELQAAWKALQDAGGLKGLLALFDERPNLQSPPGPWAARLSDLVVCPSGIGPITAPCMPTVLIGGMPAARRSDIVLCNGLPTDSIAIGEPTVRFGNLFAARREDDTAHGGKITSGWKSVHIGKKRNQTDMCLAGKCAADAADAGAATISGSGITNPLTEGAFGGLGDVFKDLAKNKLAEFASQKASEAIGDLIGADKDKIYDGSNFQNYGSPNLSEKPPSNKKDAPKIIPKQQPNIFDDED